MSFLKTIIPLLIVLGLLQAAVLALPLLYWRFSFYLNPIERYLFGAILFFTAFILHPLIVISLITFTIAPSLLSMRHDLGSRLSTIYTALIPASLSSNLTSGNNDLFAKGRPQTGKDWLLTVLGSYVGWKTIGVAPFVVVVAVFLALRGGREEDVWGGGRKRVGARGQREDGEEVEVERRETGVGLRRRTGRTDLQVVG
ncbi:hypothetical protein SVAN01_06881 [Stagonosporopsis vannaccii]|nr:hypothetical protein SVAN01_06881 [Stagonosporopsis vannaccii]